jgi:hypothetical protein
VSIILYPLIFVEVRVRRFLSLVLALGALITATSIVAQQALVVRPLAERKVAELPSGELFWRIENYASKEAAQPAAGNWSVAAEVKLTRECYRRRHCSDHSRETSEHGDARHKMRAACVTPKSARGSILRRRIQSETHGNPGAYLVFQNDDNLVIYGEDALFTGG